MKYVISILSLILISLGTQAASEPPIQMTCATEAALTTSFVISQSGSKVHFRIINHSGNQYAPIWGQIVTPHDLSYLQNKADTILKLAPVLEFDFDRKGCKAESSQVFECRGTGVDFTSQGLKVSPWDVRTTEIERKSLSYSSRQKNVTFDFEIGDQSYTITMDYDLSECI